MVNMALREWRWESHAQHSHTEQMERTRLPNLGQGTISGGCRTRIPHSSDVCRSHLSSCGIFGAEEIRSTMSHERDGESGSRCFRELDLRLTLALPPAALRDLHAAVCSRLNQSLMK